MVAEPAHCQIDARASVDATARCEGKVTPPKASVACEGTCEVEATADVMCSAGAELKCTLTAPSVACEGSCRGSCSVSGSAAASCSGTCNGMCMGTCSAMNAEGQCAGSCSGTCMGSCETQLEVEATCMGECTGECTVTEPAGGCEGGVRASCEAMAGAMVMCEGRCEGEVTPPEASAECEASAKAEASFNAECTPPRVAVHYELAVGASIDVEAQARFEAAVKNLEVRLPRLLASIESAEVMVDAAAGLGAAGGTAIQTAIDDFDPGADLSVTVGLVCAAGELDEVGGVITSGTSRLNASLMAAGDFTTALVPD